ncbi:MAG: motility associated factor glycosyltransferase family protein [Alphaproteobacteria bacterium]|nr:motility associated factor glycosyltransferase family protein [Alphaproteobacteria bacterium]
MDTDALFEKNLEFFKDLNPSLHARLRDYRPLGDLLFDEDGDPDMRFEGMAFYGGGARKHAERQIKDYWENPQFVSLKAMTDKDLDLESGALYRGLMASADKHGVTFAKSKTTRAAYHLVVLGIGLGMHLPGLLDEVKPRNLILIEPNFEFVYQSMRVLDWGETYRDFIDDKGKLHLLLDDDAERLIEDMRTVYSLHGQALFDGLTVYEHYANPIYSAVMKFLATEGDMMFTGMGFFEDELNMMANTYAILESGTEKLFYADLEQKAIPAFVIGSGPSLDESLPVIRANQDKAVIISCGTGLMPVLRAGIVPDFHMELERGQYQVDIPTRLAEEFDLSRICLIGSTTLIPPVREVFARRVFFFRHLLSPFPLFSGVKRNCLRYPSPTVGNTGLSFAQDMGFRRIYFFGIDMGFADPTKHHSSNSPYIGDEAQYRYEESMWDRETRGNFGGKVKSMHVLHWARDTMEAAIRNSSEGYTYYNCSDGAYIEGTVPLLPECLDLPDLTAPKTEIVDAIVNAYPTYTKADFDSHWAGGKVIDDVHQLGRDLIQCVRDNPDLTTKKYASEMMRILRPLSFDDAAIQMVRGTLFMFMIVSEFYLDRVEQEEKKAGLVTDLCDVLCDTITQMCVETETELRHVEQDGRLLKRQTEW